MHWGQPFLCPLRAVQRKPANSKQRRGPDLREPILERCGHGMLLRGEGGGGGPPGTRPLFLFRPERTPGRHLPPRAECKNIKRVKTTEDVPKFWGGGICLRKQASIRMQLVTASISTLRNSAARGALDARCGENGQCPLQLGWTTHNTLDGEQALSLGRMIHNDDGGSPDAQICWTDVWAHDSFL